MPHPLRSEKSSRRRSALVHLAILHALGRRDEAEQLAALNLHRRVLSSSRLGSLYVHLSLLVGVPSTLDALGRLKRLTGTITLQPFKKDAVEGRRVFQKVYGRRGDAVLRALHAVHPFIPAWVIEDVYGSIFHRSGLTFAEKEVVTLTLLALNDHYPQFVSHREGARRAGVTEREIRRHIRLAARLSQRDLNGFR